jgi:hypothetical protein
MSEQKHTPSEMNFKELLSSLQTKDTRRRVRINIDDLKSPAANQVSSFVFGPNNPIDPRIFNPRK